MSCFFTTVGTSTATAVRCRCYWTSDQSGEGTHSDLPTRMDQSPVDCCYKCCVPALALTVRRLVTVWRPRGGWLRPNFTDILGTRILESLGHRMALFAWSYLWQFSYNSGVWQMDRRTHNNSIYRASITSRGKNGFLIENWTFSDSKLARWIKQQCTNFEQKFNKIIYRTLSRGALCHLKSCQLLHNCCSKRRIWKGLQ